MSEEYEQEEAPIVEESEYEEDSAFGGMDAIGRSMEQGLANVRRSMEGLFEDF